MIQKLRNSRNSGGCLRPKTFRFQKSTGKVVASVFWDKDGIIMLNFLEQGKTKKLVETLLARWHPAHKQLITLQKIDNIGFELVDY